MIIKVTSLQVSLSTSIDGKMQSIRSALLPSENDTDKINDTNNLTHRKFFISAFEVTLIPVQSGSHAACLPGQVRFFCGHSLSNDPTKNNLCCRRRESYLARSF